MGYFNGDAEDSEGVGKPLVLPTPELQTPETFYKHIREKYGNNYSTLEICITFKPELQMQWEAITLRSIVRERLLKTYKRINIKGKNIILVGEYSPTGMFHYHGLMIGFAGDDVSKIQRALRKDVGRTIIKDVRDFNAYIQYMFKAFYVIEDKKGYKVIVKQEWHPEHHLMM